MQRNLEAEIDLLKNELAELKSLIEAKHTQANPQLKKDKPQPAQDDYFLQNEVHHALMKDLELDCTKRNPRIGSIATLGCFGAGTHEDGNLSTWGTYTYDAEVLLSLIESRIAEKVLTCVGNNDRLNLLLTLLRHPRTVAELVESDGYSSSGQVYHHLKPLLAADLVAEDKKRDVKGTYIVQPHRVQGIIIMLEGIQSMINPRYTQGNWDEANEACTE
jgi:hypothetical protein